MRNWLANLCFSLSVVDLEPPQSRAPASRTVTHRKCDWAHLPACAIEVIAEHSRERDVGEARCVCKRWCRAFSVTLKCLTVSARFFEKFPRTSKRLVGRTCLQSAERFNLKVGGKRCSQASFQTIFQFAAAQSNLHVLSILEDDASPTLMSVWGPCLSLLPVQQLTMVEVKLSRDCNFAHFSVLPNLHSLAVKCTGVCPTIISLSGLHGLRYLAYLSLEVEASMTEDEERSYQSNLELPHMAISLNELSQLPGLRHLQLNLLNCSNQLTDLNFVELRNMTSLLSLEVLGKAPTIFLDKTLPFLVNLQSLKYFGAARSEDWYALQQCSCLTGLQMGMANMSRWTALRPVPLPLNTALRCIQELELDICSETDLNYLASLVTLKKLILHIRADGVLDPAPGLSMNYITLRHQPSLTELRKFSCTGGSLVMLQQRDWQAIISEWPDLQEFSYEGCFDRGCLMKSPKAVPLRRLKLASKVRRLRMQGSCIPTTLTLLSLSHVDLEPDPDLPLLRLPHLKALLLEHYGEPQKGGSSNLGLKLSFLLQSMHAHRLRELRLTSCNVDDDDLAVMARSFPFLAKLEISKKKKKVSSEDASNTFAIQVFSAIGKAGIAALGSLKRLRSLKVDVEGASLLADGLFKIVGFSLRSLNTFYLNARLEPQQDLLWITENGVLRELTLCKEPYDVDDRETLDTALPMVQVQWL